MEEFERHADEKAKQRIAELSQAQKQALTKVMQQLRKEWHGNNRAWASIDWDEIIAAVKALVPDERSDVPLYVEEWPNLTLPTEFNPYEHFTVPQTDINKHADIVISLMAQLSEYAWSGYLQALPDELLQAVEAKLSTLPPTPVKKRVERYRLKQPPKAA
jgi:hypothetical protein